jgi:hypothetical protein
LSSESFSVSDPFGQSVQDKRLDGRSLRVYHDPEMALALPRNGEADEVIVPPELVCRKPTESSADAHVSEAQAFQVGAKGILEELAACHRHDRLEGVRHSAS